MKSPRRIPLLRRFATIVVLTLVFPVIILAVFLDLRMHEVYQSRVDETLQASKTSFLNRLKLESQDLADRAATILADPGLMALFQSPRMRRGDLAENLALVSNQIDFASTWLGPKLDHPFSLGQSILDPQTLRSQTIELAQIAPSSRIMVDAQGPFMIHVSVDKVAGHVLGYLIMQHRINQADLEALRLSLGQDLSIVEGGSGAILFTNARDDIGQTLGLGQRRSLDNRVGEAKVFAELRGGKTVFSIWFNIPQHSKVSLIGVISIPDKRILAADSARSFVIIAVGVILLVIFSSILLTRAVIAPILSLSYAVESMRQHLNRHGPLVSIPIKENNEVGDLARVINGLGQDLRDSVEKIEEQRAEIVAYTHSLEERVQERTRELEEARLRAEIANHHKSKFLVNMNHELRTPLNSIAGITDLLRFGAYEKHEEMAAEFGIIWAALVEIEGVPTDLLVLLENLATGLVNETSVMRLIGRYMTERLKTSDIAISEDLAQQLEQIQILSDEEERQVFRAYNNIRDAGESLLSIIDEVINLSRIESGVITILPQRTNITDLIANCMTHAESYARSKRKLANLTFSKQIEDSVPPVLLLDGQKVKQVLLNLLTNAVKYTEQGYVHCRLGLVSIDDQSFLHCSVQDSGRGIADKDREVLFMEFGRAFEVREIEGSGLGLALSRKLIERHGGSMGFSSHEGNGSTFWFTLPLVLPGDT